MPFENLWIFITVYEVTVWSKFNVVGQQINVSYLFIKDIIEQDSHENHVLMHFQHKNDGNIVVWNPAK